MSVYLELAGASLLAGRIVKTHHREFLPSPLPSSRVVSIG
jgi:hypothetical protein